MEFSSAERGYRNLWDKMEIRGQYLDVSKDIAYRLFGNKARYQTVADEIGCPWFFVAVVHNLEAGANFHRHQHNGDPLSARTVNEPPGRPISGSPPFTWEESAIDAFRMKNLHLIQDWSLPRILYEWERFNGFGYVKHKINSPYIWSFSNLYTRGKYIRDHVYSPTAVSQQCGAAVILRRMIDLGMVAIEEDNIVEKFQKAILPFGTIAPTLIRMAAGPLIETAVSALSEALGEDSKDLKKVTESFASKEFGEQISAAVSAEDKLQQIAPAIPAPAGEAPAQDTNRPSLPQPASPSGGKIDKVLGGEPLTGLKTIIGMVVLGATYAASALGYIDQSTFQALMALGTTIFGVGITAKIDRYLGWLAPKTTKVS